MELRTLPSEGYFSAGEHSKSHRKCCETMPRRSSETPKAKVQNCTKGKTNRLSNLQTALEVKSDIRFEIIDLIYLLIHVNIAKILWAILVTSESTTASEVK